MYEEQGDPEVRPGRTDPAPSLRAVPKNGPGWLFLAAAEHAPILGEARSGPPCGAVPRAPRPAKMAPLEETAALLSSRSSTGGGDKVGIELRFGGRWEHQVLSLALAGLLAFHGPDVSLADRPNTLACVVCQMLIISP